MTFRGAWMAMMVVACGCSEEDPPRNDAGDAEIDVADETDVPRDIYEDPPFDADGDDNGSGEPPVAPHREPEPLVVDEWLVGLLSPDEPDPLIDAVETGTFAYPGAGEDERGIDWRVTTPGSNGSLGPSGYLIAYAVARVDLTEPAAIVARVDRALGVYINGAPQPADIYGSRRMRVPLVGRTGENLIVVRAFPVRGRMEVELFRTADEVFLNLGDATLPDLVDGEASELLAGVPLLNLTASPLHALRARVVENEHFEETSVEHPSVAGGAVTQIGFVLRPRAPPAGPGAVMTARLRVSSPSLGWAYERDLEMTAVPDGAAYRRTFRDPADGSVQYYGVLPPADFDPARNYALVLTLHGAGVEAIGQAGAYSPKDWAYIVAPTNRRPFGFDWEEWGRLNALGALDDAMTTFRIDPTRVYLTGHSMGGHGAWHVGVTTPGRFAVVGPSAGWESFYSYGGERRPTGAFARARAHSDTLVYLANLARRGVYIIHGSADDNVPVSEGRNMYAAVSAVADDVVYHEEPGAGHWWDGDASPGADCVDWPPLFDFMQARTLNPVETDFTFRSPSPAYSPTHSFVTLHSAVTPYEDLVVTSARTGATVEIATTNVRSMEIDGRALRGRGVTTAVVDGTSHDLPDGPLPVGPAGGKRRDVHGPLNQVFHRPFCFVHPDEGGPFAHVAAYFTSYWTIYGNGHACALPVSAVTAEIRASRNLVYLGLPADEIGDPDVPFSWGESAIVVAGDRYRDAGLFFVFPRDGRLAAAFATTGGAERLLYRVVPFSSRGGMPDYLVWSGSWARAAGFFDPEWRYDPAL